MREKHLESIRRACVAANAEKDWEWQGDYYAAPFTLADVLLAIQQVEVPFTLHLAYEAPELYLGDLTTCWNLRRDDLTEQSDECLQFLASLLTDDTV